MEKKLELYYKNGGNETPFPSSDNQIECAAFKYNAKRMGDVPTITATVMFPTCLDNKLEEVGVTNVYVKFNKEKFYLKQTPTSTEAHDSEGAFFKHDMEFVSERVILNNVYFYDAVVDNIPVDDKPVSNGTTFNFFGDIEDFAKRLKASLQYSKIDYNVIVDNGITSEEKFISFSDMFFANAIQEAYNTYKVPYYFVGKTIHFGHSSDVPTQTFKYGIDNQLLSIQKVNANYKVINRATGFGSTDNIPYYYPNNSPKGDIKAEASNEAMNVKIVDYELFSDKVAIDKAIVADFGSSKLDNYWYYKELMYANPTFKQASTVGSFNFLYQKEARLLEFV